jgi:hypothetical protein
MKRVFVVLALAAFSLLVPLASTSYATPIIDQSFPVGPFPCPPAVPSCSLNSFATFPGSVGAFFGQTFTVGLSGTLTGADLIVARLTASAPPIDWLVQIQSTLGGPSDFYSAHEWNHPSCKYSVPFYFI